VLEDLREIPVIDPSATDQALYEMLGLVFRGSAESLSKILREVTHGAIDFRRHDHCNFADSMGQVWPTARQPRTSR
jgi:hypothetical protein